MVQAIVASPQSEEMDLLPSSQQMTAVIGAGCRMLQLPFSLLFLPIDILTLESVPVVAPSAASLPSFRSSLKGCTESCISWSPLGPVLYQCIFLNPLPSEQFLMQMTRRQIWHYLYRFNNNNHILKSCSVRSARKLIVQLSPRWSVLLHDHKKERKN